MRSLSPLWNLLAGPVQGVILLAAFSAMPLHAQLAPAAQPATQLGSNTRTTQLGQALQRESYLRPVERGAGLQPGGPDTVLRPLATQPATQLSQIQQLMQDLHARETAQKEIVIDLPADVLFDFDKSSLRPDALLTLAQAAQLLAAYPKAPVRINGHTDSKGSANYNQTLSLRRAHAVAAQLQRTLPARRMQVQGFGKNRPVAANTAPDGTDNPEGRQRNRRVEIVIGSGHSPAHPIASTQTHVQVHDATASRESTPVINA